MKKLFLLILALSICLSLTACAATDPENLLETTADTDDTQPDSNDVILYQGTYQYGNMQKNVPAGNFMLLGNEVLFQHHVGNRFLVYSYDLRTGQVRCFCKDATCKHEDCAATLSHNIEVYKDKLYAMRDNGSGEETVMLNGNTVEVLLDASVYSFLHHEDKLYVETADSSLVVLEEGQTEPHMLLEEYLGVMEMIFGNYLYANEFWGGIFRIDLTAENPQKEMLIENAMGITDGEYIYYGDLNSSQLFRCNMDSSDPQLLDEREVQEGSMNFDEEYFYYRLYTDQLLTGTPDCYDIYRFPKDDPTQIEKIATLPVPVHQIFTVPGTGKIFATTEEYEGRENRVIYILDCDGSNMKKLDFPE